MLCFLVFPLKNPSHDGGRVRNDETTRFVFCEDGDNASLRFRIANCKRIDDACCFQRVAVWRGPPSPPSYPVTAHIIGLLIICHLGCFMCCSGSKCDISVKAPPVVADVCGVRLYISSTPRAINLTCFFHPVGALKVLLKKTFSLEYRGAVWD